MPGLVETANQLAVLSVGRAIQWTDLGTFTASSPSRPSASSDGSPIQSGTVVGYLSLGWSVISLGTTPSADVDVYLYYPNLPNTDVNVGQWRRATYEGPFQPTDGGIIERLNIAGATRIAMYVDNLTNGNLTAAFGSAVLES